MKMRSIIAIVCGLQSAFCSAEPWYEDQNPRYWADDLIFNYDQLAKTDALSGNAIPWTTNYWPDYQSGVAHRWQSGFPEDFSYNPPSLDRLKKMILTEKNKLSPAEKWDIMNSRYDYPTVQSERKRTHADQVSWAGLCHGWSLAAITFEEPQSYRMVNSEGIEVVLNSTDIKALVSLAVGEQANQDSILLGTHCYRSGRKNRTNLNTPECAGVNPGTFHVILANSVGVKKLPFVTNVSRDEQIWNYPVYGFESEVIGEAGPSRNASPETVRELRVETFIYKVEMQDPMTPDPVLGTARQPLGSEKYVYWLELNAQGNIVGGTWETFWHPGFIWKNRTPIRPFEGGFNGLEKVLKRK